MLWAPQSCCGPSEEVCGTCLGLGPQREAGNLSTHFHPSLVEWCPWGTSGLPCSWLIKPQDTGEPPGREAEGSRAGVGSGQQPENCAPWVQVNAELAQETQGVYLELLPQQSPLTGGVPAPHIPAIPPIHTQKAIRGLPKR